MICVLYFLILEILPIINSDGCSTGAQDVCFNNTLVCRSVCSKIVSILKLLAVSHSPQSKTHLRFVDVAVEYTVRRVPSFRLDYRITDCQQ